MEDTLREKFNIPQDWEISKGLTREKERINQSTEITPYTAMSPDRKNVRQFEYVNFCDHTGCKQSWIEK
tara:strand:+ start:1388 stop:1594 length:207 start_codon:yes stop_codon:yes gene_type:complete